MGLIDRDYMHEDRAKGATYSPKGYRSAPSNAQFWNNVSRASGTSVGANLVRALVLVLIAFMLVRIFKPELLSFNPPSHPTVPPVKAPILLTEAFPQPGQVRYYSDVRPESLVMPVVVRVQPGDAAFKHVLRITAVDTGALFCDVYLVPGQEMQLWLPAGRFHALAFVGTGWISQDRLFGDGQTGIPIPDVMTSRPGASFGIALGTPVIVNRLHY